MNREVLAVNQDGLGKPAQRVRRFGHCEVWKKSLSDGSVAIALINRGSSGSDITVKANDIGLLDESKLARNLWAQQDIADFTLELTQHVQPHATILLKIKGEPVPG
jgi:alpha-galactosidase